MAGETVANRAVAEAEATCPKTAVARTRPMTGAEYLESLRDGREVWYDGERVKDVTTHPAFRNAARSVARLYDALHDPRTRDVLTKVDRYGILTHKFMAPSYSAQELLEAREAIALWQRLGYGWMGRTPDYKAAFMATLGAAPEYYAPFEANALRWYKEYASRVLFLNHVIVDPPVDRHRPPSEVRDVFVHVEKETDGGIIVTGAKMVATASALTHASFVAANSGSAARFEEGRDDDFALVFIAPMDTPGVKLISRPSYEADAKSPFDAPLSSRFDENDAVLIFDRAFIPWENVLVYRDVKKVKDFYAASGFFNRYNFQATTRFAVKLDFMCGLLIKGVEATGTIAFRGVETYVGELVAMRNLFWALTSAMALDSEPSLGGSVIPRLEFAAAARVYATAAWSRVREIFELILAGAPIVTVSSRKDLTNPELQPLIERYYRGTGLNAHDRIKLFKLIWDAVYSGFGGRHALYERNYAGNFEQQRLDTLNWARQRGLVNQFKGLVEQCLSEYDVDGWKEFTWVWKPDLGLEA